MELCPLLLQSGEDIPFAAAQLSIHQPRLREISLIGEHEFLIGCNFLAFDKNRLSDEDKVGLENQNDFNIFMSVIKSREKARHKTDAIMVLALLFPEYKIKINNNEILLQSENISSSINEQNYSDFKDIINQMFCLEISEGDNKYDPADALAKRIADKIAKAKKKRAEKKGEDLEKITIYSDYISILSVGLAKDKNILANYTIPQIRDEFQRFQKKSEFDYYIQAKMAGAQNLEEVDNWMEKLHP